MQKSKILYKRAGIFTFFKKELLINILSHKFYTGFLLIFVIFPISIFIKNAEFKKKFETYQISVQNWLEIPRYPIHQELGVSLYRPPSPLSIFCRETGEQLGNKFYSGGIGGNFQISNYTQNIPFFNKYKKIDPFLIVSLLFSLFALLLTFDAICGEREQGTLELQLSYTTSKHNLLLGKFLSSFVLISCPLILSFSVSILYLHINKNFFLYPDDWIKLVLLLISAMLVISFFCLVGLFFSIFNKKSSTALISCLFFWAFFGIIYPNLSHWMGRTFFPIHDFPGRPVYVFNPEDSAEMQKLELSNKQTLTFIREIIQQYKISRIFSYISPIDLFQYSCSSLLSEDPEAYYEFIRQALRYNDQLQSWQKKMLKKYSWNRAFYGNEKIDLSELPLFFYKREKISEIFPKILIYFSILIFQNILFFVFAYIEFLKYDPRSLKT
jgi:ABC-type transport system involved in multi-copper enzyme maturation permease subunit